jgi:hypothetical protein
MRLRASPANADTAPRSNANSRTSRTAATNADIGAGAAADVDRGHARPSNVDIAFRLESIVGFPAAMALHRRLRNYTRPIDGDMALAARERAAPDIGFSRCHGRGMNADLR